MPFFGIVRRSLTYTSTRADERPMAPDSNSSRCRGIPSQPMLPSWREQPARSYSSDKPATSMSPTPCPRDVEWLQRPQTRSRKRGPPHSRPTPSDRPRWSAVLFPPAQLAAPVQESTSRMLEIITAEKIADRDAIIARTRGDQRGDRIGYRRAGRDDCQPDDRRGGSRNAPRCSSRR